MLSGIYSGIAAQEGICHHGFLLLGDTRLSSLMTGEWVQSRSPRGMAVLIQKQSNRSFRRKIGVRVTLIPGKQAVLGSLGRGTACSLILHSQGDTCRSLLKAAWYLRLLEGQVFRSRQPCVLLGLPLLNSHWRKGLGKPYCLCDEREEIILLISSVWRRCLGFILRPVNFSVISVGPSHVLAEWLSFFLYPFLPIP